MQRSGGVNDQTATGTQTIKNKVLNKSGLYDADNGCINYTVKINPNAINLVGITLKDAPSAGLRVNLDEFYLYEATVSVDGNTFTEKGPALTGLNITLNDDGGFSLLLPDGPKSYLLKYRCDILLDNPSFDNDISFEGSNFGDATKGESCTVSANQQGGGGELTAKNKVGLELELTDRNTFEFLDDCTFALYEGSKLIQIEKTDINGFIRFYPLKLETEYSLVQTTFNNGYDTTKSFTGQSPITTAGVPLATYTYTTPATGGTSDRIPVTNEKPYNVTYNGAGNTGGTVPTISNYYADDKVVVLGKTDTLIRTGYTFAGWKSDFDGKIYQPDDLFDMPAQNVNLTAQWTKLLPGDNTEIRTPTPPYTGDNSNLMLLFAISAISFGMLMLTTIIIRKRSKCDAQTGKQCEID